MNVIHMYLNKQSGRNDHLSNSSRNIHAVQIRVLENTWFYPAKTSISWYAVWPVCSTCYRSTASELISRHQTSSVKKWTHTIWLRWHPWRHIHWLRRHRRAWRRLRPNSSGQTRSLGLRYWRWQWHRCTNR